jgi:diguanylate cyclase (GGDEF)-like protein/PAS domain S-box-containing protein
LLPLGLTALLLSSFFIWNKIADIDATLDAKGQAIANLLAPACEYSVLSGNEATLNRLLQASARDRDVMNISVTDAHNQPIARTDPPGGAPQAGARQDETALFKNFRAPIFYTSLAVDDFESAPSSGSGAGLVPEVIGTVHVTLTREHAIARQTEAVVNGLWITAIAIMITAYFAALMARSVTSPIRALTLITNAIRQGKLHRRIDVDAGGEIGSLQEGINAMAEALERARDKERQHANDQLFMEKVKAQTTLESLGEGVITTDATGNITYLNPAARKLTGWSFADAHRRALHEVFKVISSNTRAAVSYPLRDCIDEGNTIHHDFLLTLTRDDGREFIIQDTATPIRDSHGNIAGMVLVFRDFSKLHHMSQQLAWQASHDDLTGLLNRREFEAQLARALLDVNDDSTEHALCYIDLDQFKIVNDTCGHKAGDELLKQLTLEISGKIRKHDVFARLGGDEFGIILKDCPIISAAKLATHIKDAVSAFRFSWDQHIFEIGASIGLVPIAQGHATTSDLMMTADSACYIAKDKGRNRVHVYQPTDEDIIQRSGDMQWLQTLNKSIDNDRFVLFCQLIAPIHPDSGLAPQYEILLRMRDADRGLVQPGLFIPAAERYQLMPAIDKWVIRHTFATLRDATRTGKRSLPGAVSFSLNLSAQSLTDSGFLDYVIEQFDRTGIDPALINFELTETAAIANLQRAIGIIEDLRALGCGFALDDFGSGLSSFGYLNNLPVDHIKIDGHFVRDIVDNPVSRSIVESVAHIGHVMGLRTIAECVENDATHHKARECGVDFVQGYGIERPRALLDVLSNLNVAVANRPQAAASARTAEPEPDNAEPDSVF